MRVSTRVANGEVSTDARELQRHVTSLQEQLKRLEHDRSYEALQQRITDFIRCSVPRGSTVLVVSKGDEALLEINGRRAWHFPRATNGMYAGCYPADSGEAVDHLLRLEAEGAEFLVIPSTSFWWLDFYPGLARHLRKKRRLVAYHEEVCLVFSLTVDAPLQREPGNLRGGAPRDTGREAGFE